jgi:hypothetical protein
MRNLLGIDFFRVVSEPLSGDWSQVFAKIPYEEEDLYAKGGVWGVLRMINGSEAMEKGSELLSQLEERYNQAESGRLLEKLMEGVEKHKGKIQLVLLEISLTKDGKRNLRVRGTEGCLVEIIRGGRRVILVGGESIDRVVSGSLEVGDRLLVGVGMMKEMVKRGEFDWVKGNLGTQIEVLSTEVMAGEWEESMAGLFLDCGEIEVKKEDADEEVVVVREEKKEVLPVVTERKIEEGGERKGWFRRILERRKSRVEVRVEGGEKKRRWAVFSGVVFLILLSVTVVIGYWKTKDEAEKKEFMAVYEVLDKKRKDALELAALNPSGSLEMMSQVKGEVEQKRGSFEKSKFSDTWKQLEVAVGEDWKKVSGEYQIEPELFFDFSLIRKDFLGESLTNDEGNILVLDRGSGVVVRVTYPEKKAEVVAGKGEGMDWRSAVWVGEKAVVVKVGGLIMGDKTFEEETKLADPVAIGSFGEAVYVLDKMNGEIWKFGVVGGGLSSGQRWLKGEAIEGLKQGVSMVIDSDVWVGKEDGQIIRLRRGVLESFNLTNLPGEVTLKAIAVDGERLVLLDVKGGRLIVFDKEGNYLKQISWEGLAKAQGVVMVGNGEVLVLIEGKLWKVKM